MTPRPNSERAAEQQRRIQEGLLQLMGEGEYSRISVSDICRRTGIPRRTFYYYFDSKDEVLDTMLERIVHECNLETMVGIGSTLEEIEQYFGRFFHFWEADRKQILDALLNNHFGSRLTSEFEKWVLTEGQWLRPVEDLHQEVRTIGSKLATTCVLHALFYWWESGFRQSPEEMASYVTLVLSQPLYRTR